MVGRLLYTCIEDAEVVLEELKSIRVTINLDDSKRRKAIADIAKFADEFDHRYKPDVLSDIFYAVLKELFRSAVVDGEMVAKVIEAHSINTVSDDDEDDKYKFEEFDRASERADEIDEVDWEAVEGMVEEFRKLEIYNNWVPHYVRRPRVEAIMKQYAEASMKVMEEQCRMMGCSLKQGQQSQIMDQLIPWFLDRGLRFTHYSDMQGCIERFMNEVERYIARSCVLDDLETVTKAIQVARLDAQKFGYSKNVKFDGCDMEVEDQLFHRICRIQLEKNTAPTDREGITTQPPCMNQFKQEQSEQTKEFENVVTPLKPEQEEEITGNVDVCGTQTPEWEGMEIEDCMQERDEEEKGGEAIPASIGLKSLALH